MNEFTTSVLLCAALVAFSTVATLMILAVL